jgi:poly(glycerol-phosphate) alpha-glucosyltransferase
MTTALVVAKQFDLAGFGLSLAACAFSNHLTPDVVWKGVSLLPLSGKELTDRPVLYRPPTGIYQRIMHIPAGVMPAVDDFKPEVVHLHGMFNGAILLIPALKRRGIRIVVTPHGMCDLYVRSRWKIRVKDVLLYKRRTRMVDAIHCLNAYEADCVQAYMGKECPPVVVIPNGVEDPGDLPPRPAGPRTFLFCGRFNHKKNLEGLLAAWQDSGVAAEGHRLAIAGDGHDEYGMRVKALAARTAGVELLGPVDGAKKDAAYRAAHFGILASHSEGLPLAVLESLAYGMPCVITTGCRMPEIGRGLGWSVEYPDFAKTVRLAAALPQADYLALSAQATAYARSEHSWPKIGEKLTAVYAGLCGRGPGAAAA